MGHVQYRHLPAADSTDRGFTEVTGSHNLWIETRHELPPANVLVAVILPRKHHPRRMFLGIDGGWRYQESASVSSLKPVRWRYLFEADGVVEYTPAQGEHIATIAQRMCGMTKPGVIVQTTYGGVYLNANEHTPPERVVEAYREARKRMEEKL